MLKFREQFFLLAATCILLAAGPAFTQSERINKGPTLKPDPRSARALYEEATGYLEKKFAELSKQKVPYDPKLEATIKQEQKDLAARNAATLEVRGSPAGEDSYYLGMLHHLSGNRTKRLLRCGDFSALSQLAKTHRWPGPSWFSTRSRKISYPKLKARWRHI